MASITLSRAQVERLVDFCRTHGRNEWFVANDHGAYVGASIGSGEGNSVIYYFKGCDPTKDEDFYDNAWAKFGGDDFGEMLPLEWLTKLTDMPHGHSFRLTLTATSIKADYMVKKAGVAA